MPSWGFYQKKDSKLFMRKFLALFIIFLMFLNTSVFATGVISVPSLAPSQTVPPLSSPSLTPIKPFEIFTPGVAPITPHLYLPPLTPMLSREQAKMKPKIPKTKPRSNIFLEPPIKPAQEAISPIQIGTSAEDKNYIKISLPEAIDYAMSHNFGIQSVRLENDKAKNDIKTAGKLLNPRIESFLNLGRAAIDNPDYMGLIFPIELFKRAPRKKLAQSNLELTKGSVLLAELNLRLDTRQAYVNLVTAKSTLKVLNDQKQLLQELLYIAQRKFEVGKAPQIDIIQAKMALNQLILQVNSAKTDILVARYKFNLVLLSKDFDTREDYLPEQKEFVEMLTPSSEGKLPPFEEILERALSKRYDIKNAMQDIDVARKNLTVVIRKRIPDIELGAGALYVPSTLATDGQTNTGMLLVGNIVNIPLLYQYTPEIKNAKLLVEQKELIYKNTLHVATMNLHSAYDSFVAAQMNLNYYNDVILTESGRYLNMAKESYIVGKSNMTNLLYIEQSYRTIIMGYTIALANYYNAWVDVLQEVNDEDFKLNE